MTELISLRQGTLHRIRSGPGTRIHVREGELWVTQHLDWRDRILIAGQSIVLDRDGPALVSALRDSVFATSLPKPGRSLLGRAWSALIGPLARMA